MSNLIDTLREKARALGKTICLPEAVDDARTVKAARQFADEKLGTPLIVGSEKALKEMAQKAEVSLDGIRTIDPAQFEKMDEMVALYQTRRAKENLTDDQARAVLVDPLYFGAMLVSMDLADGMTAGAIHTTADVIRASIKCIGPRQGLKTVSSAFLMIVPDASFGIDGALIYSDCGVIPAPTQAQLVDIGDAAAQTFRQLVGGEPIVAFLSFSTKGSADHPAAKKMADAAAALAERRPDLQVDGELQGDAALIPSVGKSKAPGSQVAGRANTLIFPDLGAGNIAYKLTQRLAKAEAFGPLLQGLAKPVNDLSRGATTDDVVQVAAITALQTQ
ncbi:phosphate acetyltransferase [Candidatus Sumerlaeota bacterium]|nr:phosphate acetyltransferase [Candidatus Sumerlaeota bacterium]